MARLPRLPRVAVGHRGPIIGIDVETASPAHGAVCSVGVSVVLGTRVIGEEHWFTDPKTEFHPRFVAIHGITPAKVAGRPPLARLWPEVEAFIRRTIETTLEPSLFSPPPELDGDASDLGPHPAAPALHVAHNAPFDRLQIERAIGRPLSMQIGCTVAMSRRAFPRLGRHDLATVARHLGIELRHHDALSDARASALIASRCILEGAAPR